MLTSQRPWNQVPVVVTGANGFLGCHVVGQLLALGATVTCLVRERASLLRLQHYRQAAEVLAVDYQDPACLNGTLQRIAPRVLFHLAGSLDPALGDRAFAGVFAANVKSTLHVTTAARDAGCERIVLAGSCAEYAPSDRGLDERSLLQPTTPYAASKTAAWALATGQCAGTSTAVTTIRLFTPYGPWERASRFVPAVIQHCLAGEPMAMTVGTQARDYLYVDDAARAFLLAGAAQHDGNETYNIGSGSEIPIAALAERIAELTQRSSSLFLRGALPLRDHEFFHQRAITSKAQSRLGWQATTTLDQGLLQTINWYREQQALVGRLT